MASNFARGIVQFGRIENPHSGPTQPLRELNWLTRRVVSYDKQLHGKDRVTFLSHTKLYLQRLREIGFTFGEIFVFQEYADWQPTCENPRIIDLGGDVGGFSVLYWKSVAPHARVTVVEANPSTAAVMAESFKRKGLHDIEVINAAASDSNGSLDLHLSGYNPTNFVGIRKGSLSSKVRTVTVPSVRASDLIGSDFVHLYKIDIEGGEGAVIDDLTRSGKMQQIGTIMMEYHSDPNNPDNSLENILRNLGEAGFNISNVHRSGIGRLSLRRTPPFDLKSKNPKTRIAFAFSAKK